MKQIAAFEVPADVQNDDRAIEMLGGMEAIHHAKAEDNMKRQIHLKLGHGVPILGVFSQTSNVLVKVRRSKRTGEVTTKIVGIVNKTWQFDTLGDYQYVPPEPFQQKMSVEKEMEITDVYMPPPAFTKWLYPFPYHFEENAFTNKTNTTTDVIADGLKETVLKNMHWIPTQFFRINDPGLPCESESAYDSLNEVEKEIYEVLRKLFDERPMWIRASLLAQMPQRYRRISWMQKPLQTITYFTVDGPFRHTYGRLGYDPRKDPAAKMYQTIDFRDPYFRTTDCLVNSREDPDGYDFSFRKPPVNKSQIYQFMDIEDTTIQRILLNAGKGECDALSGWFHKKELTLIRQQMKVKAQAMRRSDEPPIAS